MTDQHDFRHLRDRLEMDWRAWRLKAERVVAELIGVPVSYIVLDVELPADSCDGCWGSAWPEMAVMLREEIGTRWAGDGPALILNTTAIEAALPIWIEQREDAVDAVAWGVVSHEVAHILDYPEPTGRGLATGLNKSDFLTIPAVRHPPAPRPAPRPDEHGAKFCWTGLHVHHRLALRGIEACLIALIDYELFGLPRPAFVLRDAIVTELRAMARLPLRAIARYPPPDAFQDLFKNDHATPLARQEMFPASTVQPVPESKGNCMFQFFEKLQRTQSANTVKKQDDWQSLVFAVADGPDPDEAAALETLTRLGKEPADLQRAVQTLQRRRLLIAKINAAERARAEFGDMDHQERAATEVFNEAQAKYQQTVFPLIARREAIQNDLGQADAARDELNRLSAGSALAVEIKAADDELHSLRRSNLADGDRLDELRVRLRSLESSRGSWDNLPDPERQVSNLQSAIATLQTEVVQRVALIGVNDKLNEARRARLFDPNLVV